MLNKRIEVAITEQKRVIAFNTSRCNQSVNGLSNRHPFGTKSTKISGCLNSNFLPTKFDHIQSRQQLPCLVKVPITAKALQHLGQNQVTHDKRLASQQGIQSLRLRRDRASEKINPYA